MIMLLLTLHPMLIKDQLMIGYSSFNLLPFVDDGVLEFQIGESLWAISLGGDSHITLISPKGSESTITVREEPMLLKVFGEDSPKGTWILRTSKGELQILLRDPNDESPWIKYRFSGENLVAEIFNGSGAVFLNPSNSNMILMIAGIRNNIQLNSSIPDGEYAGDIIYPKKFIYQGFLDGASYRFESESIVGRILVRIKGGNASLILPELHSVGAGGLLPLRIGEALMRIRLNETENIYSPIYILDGRFRNFMGKSVSRSIIMPLRNLLNQSVNILLATEEDVKTIELKPPISILRFYDPSHGALSNLTIHVENMLSTTLGDTSYILLKQIEPLPRKSLHPTRGVVDIFVNGFKVGVIGVSLKAGEVAEIPIKLHKLSITVVDRDGEILKNGKLRINGRSMEIMDGKCSYLLPPGIYRLEVEAAELRGSTTIQLSSDTSVKLKLHRIYDVDELLRFIAIVEMFITAALIILYIVLRFRGPVSKWFIA